MNFGLAAACSSPTGGLSRLPVQIYIVRNRRIYSASSELNQGSLTLSMTRNSLLPEDSRAAFSLTKRRLAEIFLCPVSENSLGLNSPQYGKSRLSPGEKRGREEKLSC